MQITTYKMNRHPSHKDALLAWLLTVFAWFAGLGVLAWTLLSDSFDAAQSRLHPVLVIRNLMSQVTAPAPPWEWHVPLWSVAVWAAWLISTWGLGWLALALPWSRDAVKRQPAGNQAVLVFSVGFTLFGLLILITGLAGLVRLPLIPGVLAVTGLVSWRRTAFRDDVLRFPRAIKQTWQEGGPGHRLALLAMACALVFMLPPALTPPAQSDAVRYHLGAPQEYLKHGEITYLPHNAYSNMPFLVEMHYLQALASSAPEATQLMHMTLALFTALAIYSLVSKLNPLPITLGQHEAPGPGRTWLALLPAILYLTTPMAAVLGTWPYNDHAMALFLVMSVLAAILCINNEATDQPTGQDNNGPGATWLVLGVCLGGLLGTKYTMAPVALLLLVLTVLIVRRHARRWQYIAGAVASAGLTGLPWYLKNWYFTGNPFYPLASRLFPGGEWGITNDKFLQSRAGLKGSGTRLSDLMELPYTSTFRWTAFESHNPGATTLVVTGIAVLAVATYWGRPARRPAMLALATAAASLLVWFYSYQSNRLLLPVMALILGTTPIGLFVLQPAARRLFAGGVALTAALGLAWAVQWSWVATSLTPRPLPYLLGKQDAKSYLYKSLTYARAFDYLNKHVSPGDRVLLVGEHRIFGAKFQAVWSDWFDTPALAQILRINHLKSTDILLDYLRRKNISWIMINEKELEPQLQDAFRPWFSPAEWQIFEELRVLDQPGVTVRHLPPGVTLLHLEPRK